MGFIAQFWWLWLIGVVLFGGMAAWISWSGARGMMRSATANEPSFARAFHSASEGVGKTIVLVILTWISGILLTIAVVINIIQHVSK